MALQIRVKRLLTLVIASTLGLIGLWIYHFDNNVSVTFASIEGDGFSNEGNPQAVHNEGNPQAVHNEPPIWRFRAKVSHRRPFDTLPYPPLEKRYSTNLNDSIARIIMYWTTLWGKKSWGRPFGKAAFEKCAYNNCRAEYDRKYLEQADILLFYQVSSDWHFARERYPKQIYAVITGESPSEAKLRHLSRHMNLTLSSRLESDIVLNYIVRRKENVIPGKYVPRVPFSKRTSNVSWLVGHCKTSSKREAYVDVLSKHIDVDIYGGCGSFKCKLPRRGKENSCFKELEQKYKFYLSFENSICKDYATEKLNNPLKHEIVPVVLGGGDYARITPPNSYIDAADFRTPKDLADYLHFLASNEEEYMKYFQWKNEYDYFNRQDAMCDLCEIAMKGTFQRTAETWDSGQWWEHNACDNGLVDRILAQS